MKKNIILFITAILFSACNKDSLNGQGFTRTEDRSSELQGGFSSIRINGSTDAMIVYGSNYKLEVAGYSNLLSALSTKVINQTLVVEFVNYYNVKNDNTKITVTIPRIPNLYINGEADAYLTGIFPAQESIDFTVNGSANISATNVIMTTQFANYKVNGNGEIDGYSIIAKNAESTVSGNGKIKTNVLTNLKATISGNGRIYYKGNPTLTTEISGSGKVLHSD